MADGCRVYIVKFAVGECQPKRMNCGIKTVARYLSQSYYPHSYYPQSYYPKSYYIVSWFLGSQFECLIVLVCNWICKIVFG